MTEKFDPRDPFQVADQIQREHPEYRAVIVGHWTDTPPEGHPTAILVATVRVHPHDPYVRIWAIPA